MRANDFEEAVIVVPEGSVDTAFAKAISPLHELGWKLRVDCSTMVKLRALLLPKLVTGQIDVSTLDIEALIEEHV